MAWDLNPAFTKSSNKTLPQAEVLLPLLSDRAKHTGLDLIPYQSQHSAPDFARQNLSSWRFVVQKQMPRLRKENHSQT